jgi:hypothetical protein
MSAADSNRISCHQMLSFRPSRASRLLKLQLLRGGGLGLSVLGDVAPGSRLGRKYQIISSEH